MIWLKSRGLGKDSLYMRTFMIIFGLCVALAGCGATSSAASHSQVYARSTASRSGTAASPPATAAFAKAQAQWKQSARVAAANAGRCLRLAAADLQAAGGNGYAAAEKALMELAAIPETGTTRAQQAQARADVALLDGFFKTPGMTPNG